MIPFPGESLAVWDYANTSGTPIPDYDAITYRAGVSTFTAGDEAWVDVDLSPFLLEAGSDAVVSWVIEVEGGSGTLDLTEDAGSLGSHPATAGTLVVASSLTAADVLAGGMARLTVACTAGTVVVQQVKLRVWPPGGALGGWSADPYTQAPNVTAPDTFIATGGGTPDLDYPTQAAFRAALAPLTVDGTILADPDITAGAMTAYPTPTPGVSVVGGGPGIGYVTRNGSFSLDGPGDEGVDWVRPPDEVPGDDDAVTFQTTGPAVVEWTQPVATVVLTPQVIDGSDAYPIDGPFHIGATDIPALDTIGTSFLSLVGSGEIHTAGQPAGPIASPGIAYENVTLPEFDDILRVTIWHDGHLGDIAEIGGTGATLVYGITTDGTTFDRLEYSWTPAPYYYWLPTAVVEVVGILRHWPRNDGRRGTSPSRIRQQTSQQSGRGAGYS